MPPEGEMAAAAQGAGNNSSDFVSLMMVPYLRPHCRGSSHMQLANLPDSRFANYTSNSHLLVANRIALLPACTDEACFYRRMLEDPAYSEVVRWGNEGDSFVVLEVSLRAFVYLPNLDIDLGL